jgi:hypothetical protein
MRKDAFLPNRPGQLLDGRPRMLRLTGIYDPKNGSRPRALNVEVVIMI